MTTTIPTTGVLLDMDGTLIDSTAVVDRVWTEWALAHGLEPADVVGLVHGRQSLESIALLLPGCTPAEHAAENDAMERRETAETEGIVAVPGAAALLTALAGVPHALVTSASDQLARTRMAAAGLPVPAVAVTAERVTASKPDPEGFLVAAANLGLTPGACVVLEDSAVGIEAARRAGMRVVGVGAGAAAHGPDWTVRDLTEIRVDTRDVVPGLTLTLA